MVRGWINDERTGFLTLELKVEQISREDTLWRYGKYRDVQGKLHAEDYSLPNYPYFFNIPANILMGHIRIPIFATEHEALHNLYMNLLNKSNKTIKDAEQIALLECLGISKEVTDK